MATIEEQEDDIIQTTRSVLDSKNRVEISLLKLRLKLFQKNPLEPFVGLPTIDPDCSEEITITPKIVIVETSVTVNAVEQMELGI